MSPPSSAAPRVLIAVCTLNEAGNIESMIAQLRRSIPDADVVVIDDSSTDGTGEIVRRHADADPQVKLIVRQQRGLGGAIRHAMQVAIDGDYDWFVNLDGDLSHDPQQLPAMVDRAIADPPVDVVIGSRYVDGGSIVGWPIHRKVMSKLVNRFATLCLRLPVSDCSGSMRCYRVAALRRIDIGSLRSNGYAVLEEVLVRLDRQSARMVELPITFTDRQRGHSKLTAREAARSASQMAGMAWAYRRRKAALTTQS